MKKIILSIGAAAMIAVAAIGQSSDNKMSLINTDKRIGFAIKNTPPLAIGPIDVYGIEVEQVLYGHPWYYRVNKGIRVTAVATSSLNNLYSSAYGIHATAGGASSGYNYGVFAGLEGNNNGTALYATWNDNTVLPFIDDKYAAYFLGKVHMTGNLHVSGNIGYTGSLLQSSDLRYKTNIKDLGSSVDKIAKLRPVTYNLKPEDLSKYYELLPDSVKIDSEEKLREYFGLGEKIDENQKYIGFIAQEIKEIFPELVHEDKGGMLSVNYVSLVPVLVGTVQEQNKVIDKQGKTIQEMSNLIQEMNRRLEALEKNTDREGIVQGSTPVNDFSFTLFPNPAGNGIVTVDNTMYIDAPICIELYNMFGQRVKLIAPQQNQKAGTYSVQISVSDLGVGTYIV